MSINPNKSACIRFSPRFNAHCEQITSISGVKFKCVDNCRYLGVYCFSGKQFRCSFDTAKSLFFTSFNSIFSKVGRFASEEVVINLLRSKCIPILHRGMSFFVCDKHSFDFSLTRIFMKLL